MTSGELGVEEGGGRDLGRGRGRGNQRNYEGKAKTKKYRTALLNIQNNLVDHAHD